MSSCRSYEQLIKLILMALIESVDGLVSRQVSGVKGLQYRRPVSNNLLPRSESWQAQYSPVSEIAKSVFANQGIENPTLSKRCALGSNQSAFSGSITVPISVPGLDDGSPSHLGGHVN
jgi:hypothetical protein